MMPGAPAIDFEMTDVNGKNIICPILGKLFILTWATGADHVAWKFHMEKFGNIMPRIRRLNFEYLVGRESKEMKKKLAADKPEWKQFICPDNFQSTLCQECDIDGIPVSYSIYELFPEAQDLFFQDYRVY
ncbi:MAG: hypothetical protein ACLUDU_03340 [Butyricimonas faecihominis]